MDDSTIIEQDTGAITTPVQQPVEPTIVEPTNVEPEVLPQPDITPAPTPQEIETVPVTWDPTKDEVQNIVQNAVQLHRTQNMSNKAGSAMNRFLNYDYDYDREEAGSYWVAGAINDRDTQMKFLDAIINEEMYDEMDLQKYYYDTTLATARAYAAAKDKETAYAYYRAAQEKAIAEAQLTGWYMPAEGQYMLANYVAAQSVLSNEDSTTLEKAKANNVVKTTETWFAANNISSLGMKCLNMLEYEETVRHNKEMERLQDQANEIAGRQANAAAGAAKWNLKLLKFQTEEMELASGLEYTNRIGMDNNPDFIGHDIENDPDYAKYQSLAGFKNAGDLLQSRFYSEVLGTQGEEFTNNLANYYGLNGKDLKANWDNSQTNTALREAINNGDTQINENLFTATGSYLNGEEIKALNVNGKYILGTWKDGNFTALTASDKDKILKNKMSLEDWANKKYGENNVSWDGTDAIEVDGKVYGIGAQPQEGINSPRNIQQLGYVPVRTSNSKVNWNQGDQDWYMQKYVDITSDTGVRERNGNVISNAETTELVYTKGWNNFHVFKKGDNYYYLDDDGYATYIPPKYKDKLVDVSNGLNNVQIGDTCSYNYEFGSGIGEVNRSKENAMKNGFKIVGPEHAIDPYSSGIDINVGERDESLSTSILVYPHSDGTATFIELHNEGGHYKVVNKTNNVNEANARIRELGGTPYREVGTPQNSEVLTEAEAMPEASSTTLEDMVKEFNDKIMSSSKGSISSSSSGSIKDTRSESQKRRDAIFDKYPTEARDDPQFSTIMDPLTLEEELEKKYGQTTYYGSFLGKER